MLFTVNQINNFISCELFNPHDKPINSIDFDSRRLKKNSLFIALTIGQNDGHDFIEKAINKGANTILISKKSPHLYTKYPEVTFLLVDDTLRAFHELARFHRNRLNIPFIAVTGSNGKTTTKDILYHVLSTNKKVYKTHKNFNNHLGVPYSILHIDNSYDIAVLEVGMNHSGEIDLLADIIKPNYAIITNIGESHIEFLGSKEGITHAKGELLPHVNSDGYSFIPYDSEFFHLLKEKCNNSIIPFGNNSNNKTLASSRIMNLDNGTFFTFESKSFGSYDFSIPLFGKHNVSNSLPAIYIAFLLNYSFEDIQKGLSSIEITEMRFQLINGINNSTIINDCYNASPTSMKASIDTFLKLYPNKNKIIVLGDMYELGENTEELHASVGEFLTTFTNQTFSIITIGEYSKIINSKVNHSIHFENKNEAILYLRKNVKNNDALLFKASRGMKLEEIINSIKTTVLS